MLRVVYQRRGYAQPESVPSHLALVGFERMSKLAEGKRLSKKCDAIFPVAVDMAPFPLWVGRHENDLAIRISLPQFLSEHNPIDLRHNDVTHKTVRTTLTPSKQGRTGIVERFHIKSHFQRAKLNTSASCLSSSTTNTFRLAITIFQLSEASSRHASQPLEQTQRKVSTSASQEN